MLWQFFSIKKSWRLYFLKLKIPGLNFHRLYGSNPKKYIFTVKKFQPSQMIPRLFLGQRENDIHCPRLLFCLNCSKCFCPMMINVLKNTLKQNITLIYHHHPSVSPVFDTMWYFIVVYDDWVFSVVCVLWCFRRLFCHVRIHPSLYPVPQTLPVRFNSRIAWASAHEWIDFFVEIICRGYSGDQIEFSGTSKIAMKKAKIIRKSLKCILWI